MAVIYCFSSTGNSLHVAQTLAQSQKARIIPIKGDPEVCQEESIGFIFPAYFWNMPIPVKEFVEKLIITKPNPYIYAVVTYGGMIAGVAGGLDKLLRKKGQQLSYSAQIKMIDNYLPMFDPKADPKLDSEADQAVRAIAADLAAQKVVKTKASTPINGLFSRVYPRKGGKADLHFRISDSCTQCGICTQVCPKTNIQQNKQGRPIFSQSCELCMGCVNACPVAAIDWKNKTAGKNRYRHSQVSLKNLIEFWSQAET